MIAFKAHKNQQYTIRVDFKQNKFMQIEQSQNISQPTPQRPSLEEFYLMGMKNYHECVVDKINLHLYSQSRTKQAMNYSKETNEELTKRSEFLNIIYDYISVVKTISNHLLDLIQYQKPLFFVPFKQWLKTLILSIDELTKINRLKTEQHSISDFKQKLVFLLYETQVFAFQIFIRIYLHQQITEERQKFEYQLHQLYHRYHSFQESQKREGPVIIPKDEKRRRKILFKEINQIINFYQCQISINRVDCTEKPQICYLLDLLKEKINQKIFKEVLDKTLLGYLYQNLNISVKAHNFSPFIIIPIKTQDKIAQQQKQKKLSFQKMESLCFYLPSQAIIQQKKNLQQSVRKQKNRSASKTLSPEVYCSPEVKREQKVKESAEKKESDSAKKLKSLHKKINRQSTPMAQLSSQEKLQFIGFNQRFSQNVCNLTKRLVKVKKERDFEDDSKSSSRYPSGYIQSAREVIYCPASWEDFSENILVLAQETPIVKKEPLEPEGL